VEDGLEDSKLKDVFVSVGFGVLVLELAIFGSRVGLDFGRCLPGFLLVDGGDVGKPGPGVAEPNSR